MCKYFRSWVNTKRERIPGSILLCPWSPDADEGGGELKETFIGPLANNRPPPKRVGPCNANFSDVAGDDEQADKQQAVEGMGRGSRKEGPNFVKLFQRVLYFAFMGD